MLNIRLGAGAVSHYVFGSTEIMWLLASPAYQPCFKLQHAKCLKSMYYYCISPAESFVFNFNQNALLCMFMYNERSGSRHAVPDFIYCTFCGASLMLLCIAVLRIRIRSDPDLFGRIRIRIRTSGTGSGSGSGSGSGP
jgi:hypothetical protein